MGKEVNFFNKLKKKLLNFLVPYIEGEKAKKKK